MDVIKVSADSRTSAVAGAIAGVVREHNRAEVQAIGAGAVNQAVKAIAIARGYLQEDGLFVICFPEFTKYGISASKVGTPALRRPVTSCKHRGRLRAAVPTFQSSACSAALREKISDCMESQHQS